MLTKLIKLMGILVIALLVSSPALAASYDRQNPGVMSAQATPGKYTNPLSIQIPNDGTVQNCGDPSLIRGQTSGDTDWYMYCTTDPLNNTDKTDGNFNFHLIPMLRSSDLVNWTYAGDAFSARPSWAENTAGLWAPEIQFFNGQYYLYYTVTDTIFLAGNDDSAIGVATSNSPLGPWVDSGTPVVETHAAPCCPGSRRWVFDPEIVETNGQRLYILRQLLWWHLGAGIERGRFAL